jgi:hypothetical protein
MTCQILCTGRKWVDFVSFDNRVRESKQLFIVRFKPTQKEIDDILTSVRAFLTAVEKEMQ